MYCVKNMAYIYFCITNNISMPHVTVVAVTYSIITQSEHHLYDMV